MFKPDMILAYMDGIADMYVALWFIPVLPLAAFIAVWRYPGIPGMIYAFAVFVFSTWAWDRNKMKPAKPQRPVTPTPFKNYCPYCEQELKNVLGIHPVYGRSYDCPTCEIIWDEHSVDPYPGKYHGKPNPGVLVENEA